MQQSPLVTNACDAAIRYICVNPKAVLAFGAPNPGFSGTDKIAYRLGDRFGVSPNGWDFPGVGHFPHDETPVKVRRQR